METRASPETSVKAPAGRERRAAGVFWLSAALLLTLLWTWRNLSADPVGRMGLGVDFNHQLSQLAWIHRALFHGEGPLLSQPLFHPLKGVLATSELPLLPGVVFGLFRELGAPPVFAWNLTYALASLGNAAAMFLAVRGEGGSRPAAFVGALGYATSAWIGIFGDAIYYRCSFGPPLTWYFLSQLRRDGAGAHPLVWLGFVLPAQLLCSGTILFASLIVLCVRLAADRGLWSRRLWFGVAAALLPAVLLGLGWRRVSSAAMTALGMDRIQWVYTQFYYHLDVANFLPAGARARLADFVLPTHVLPRIAATSVLPPVGMLLLAALALFGVRKKKRAQEQNASPDFSKAPDGRVFAAAALVGTVLIWVCGRLALLPATGGDPHWAQHAASTALWWGGVGAVYCSRRRGGLFLEPDTRVGVALWILLAAVLLALGPLVFVFGRPALVGPTAVLDILVSGFKRIRVPPKLLPAGACALALLAAWGVGELEKKKAALGCALGATIALWLGVFRVPTWLGPTVPRSVALAPEACPRCSPDDLNTLPEPYEWLRQNAPGEAVLELPAGFGELPLEGEAPLGGHDNTYQFYYALDGIPRVNGVSSWFPAAYVDLREALAGFPDVRSLEAIRAWPGIDWVVVHGNRYPPERWERVREALDPPPAGWEPVRRWGPVRLYRLGPGAPAAVP